MPHSFDYEATVPFNVWFVSVLFLAGFGLSWLLSRMLTRAVLRLSSVAKETANSVIITDPHGHIRWVNPAFERTTGYHIEEVLGMRPGALLQGEHTDPDAILAMREGIAKGRDSMLRLLTIVRTAASLRLTWFVILYLMNAVRLKALWLFKTILPSAKPRPVKLKNMRLFKILSLRVLPDYLFVKDQEFRLIVANKNLFRSIR